MLINSIILTGLPKALSKFGKEKRNREKRATMATKRLISWNVNGLRAVCKKGFCDWLLGENPDILCLQETKAHEDQVVREMETLGGYHRIFTAPEKKGYSGVAVFSREKPLTASVGLGVERFDREGRVLVTTFSGFKLFNVYFPNGKSRPERLAYKMDFYEHFLNTVSALRAKGERIVICGDVNTAHKAIDLARPRENEKISGFLPEEREWMDRFVAAGFLDTFRLFESGAGHYSWWDMKSGARARNVGWRIDYFFVSDNLAKNVKSAGIRPEILGSDHCPVTLELAL